MTQFCGFTKLPSSLTGVEKYHCGIKYPTRPIDIYEKIIILFPDISYIILKFHLLIISHLINIF